MKCSECGKSLDDPNLITKPGFVEKRMKLMEEHNNKVWDELYEEYLREQYPPFGGPFTQAMSFFDWLKQYYIIPERK